MKKAIGYIRKSRGKQKLSDAVQLDWIKQFCSANGYELTDVYYDTKSGRTNERVGFKTAIGYLASNPESTLVVGRIDRIARNLASFAILEPVIKQIRSVNLGNSEINEMLFSVLLSIAKAESEAISMRVKAAYKQCIKNNPDFVWGSTKGLKNGRAISLKIRQVRADKHTDRLWNAVNLIDSNLTMTWRKRAELLNQLGLKSPSGKTLNYGNLRASCLRHQKQQLETLQHIG